MLAKSSPARGAGRRPAGVQTAELLLLLPVLLLLFYGMAGLCELLVARQALDSASREGARVAAVGGDESEIKAAVRRTLAASGPLAECDVDIRYLGTDDDSPGARRVVVVTTSAPAGVALLGMPASVQSTLGDKKIVGIATMRME